MIPPVLTISIEPDIHQYLKIQKKNGVTKSYICKQALREYMNRHPAKEVRK